MSERFFVAPPMAVDHVTLTGDEARHLVAVMRAQVGDEVTLFDGSGIECLARVAGIRKQAVELTIVERKEVSRELAFELTLAVALPKGERQKWLVEKATELGVTRLVPLVTQRGVAQPVAGALERLRRYVIEACKQCGRNRLMEIASPLAARELFSDTTPPANRLLADLAGQPLASISLGPAVSLIAAIGPEGGFATDEITVAEHSGWQLVSLGPRILRIETAALAIAAWAAGR